MPTTIRRATPADAPALAGLRWRFKREDHDGPRAPERPVAEAEAWLRARLGDGGPWLVWVAVDGGGEVTGHVFLNLVERVPEPFAENRPLGYVTNFYVVPEHRNAGAGRRLLDAVREYAADAGLAAMVVWPSERSAALYRRAGFGTPEDLLEARV